MAVCIQALKNRSAKSSNDLHPGWSRGNFPREILSSVAAAAVAAGTFGQIFRDRDAAEFDGLGDDFLEGMLQVVHFLLRIEEAGRDGVFQQRVAVFFKRRDFRWVKLLAVVLFFLECLALAHQRFILATRRGIGEESINALADAAGLKLFEDGFAKLVRFRFNFCRHIICGENKPHPAAKSKCQCHDNFPPSGQPAGSGRANFPPMDLTRPAKIAKSFAHLFMEPIHLHKIDYTILAAYVAFVIGIGWMLARYMKTSADFLTSARSIPTWVTGLAFISANLGALELVGMAASGAKYGIATAHFYWVGAIPAMIFLAVFMMPFYYGSKARSVPEYLKMRFDERVRALNAVAFALMTIFASGISMDALAKLLNQLLGWNYNFALLICSGVVLVYVLKGGLTSAIYTEVLQFFMIVLGFAPVVYLGLKDVGGWHAMNQSLQAVATDPAALYLKPAGVTYAPDAWTSAWTPVLAGPAHNPMGVDIIAMVFGLGFVLSFGY